ncbi:CLUMA_CG014569, isoform A [Clunio marinus]|uniref:CLUMA_CG014569, isoform A n=1 Tax=Clunio marinus TaxID=568069 RepID=A0A1J1IL95_9DIPT|nr:CLUMA_CG014569, isoform A [Clunio marinus]
MKIIPIKYCSIPDLVDRQIGKVLFITPSGFQKLFLKALVFCWFGLPASGFLVEKPAKTSMLVPALSNPSFCAFRNVKMSYYSEGGFKLLELNQNRGCEIHENIKT